MTNPTEQDTINDQGAVEVKQGGLQDSLQKENWEPEAWPKMYSVNKAPKKKRARADSTNNKKEKKEQTVAMKQAAFLKEYGVEMATQLAQRAEKIEALAPMLHRQWSLLEPSHRRHRKVFDVGFSGAAFAALGTVVFGAISPALPFFLAIPVAFVGFLGAGVLMETALKASGKAQGKPKATDEETVKIVYSVVAREHELRYYSNSEVKEKARRFFIPEPQESDVKVLTDLWCALSRISDPKEEKEHDPRCTMVLDLEELRSDSKRVKNAKKLITLDEIDFFEALVEYFVGVSIKGKEKISLPLADCFKILQLWSWCGLRCQGEHPGSIQAFKQHQESVTQTAHLAKSTLEELFNSPEKKAVLPAIPEPSQAQEVIKENETEKEPKGLYRQNPSISTVRKTMR